MASGLEIAMYRMGWNLLSPRKELTRLNCTITFIMVTPIAMRTIVHIKNMAISGAQKRSGRGYAAGSRETQLFAAK